uniref:6-phosphogluconolactonase n=1 Tax=Panagrolaimus sp. JU765 TaxID=591449 RepID=A0AC34RJN3_9BILA
LHCSENKFALLPDQHFIAPPTSGPRHLIFHPTLPLAFLITELSNELLVLSPSNGTFTVLQKLSTIDYPGVEEDDPTSEIQNAAHIAFSNDGKFLLCSNRGKINSVVVYKINEKEKKLEFFDAVHSNGTLPRYFQLIDDKFLIVANQKGFNLTVFKYADGKIDKKPLDKLDIVAPICMQLL